MNMSGRARYHTGMNRRLILAGIAVLLAVLNFGVWYAVLEERQGSLTVAFLDVGQGDAIFIEGPTGIQMLIDGGRDRAVLRELGKRMSPFDRSIDIVVETHPDADHIGGLTSVFERYAIGKFMGPGIGNDTNVTDALIAAVGKETGVQQVLARRGMRLDLGGGAYADILYPDKDVSMLETNDGSIVMRVVYGETSFMLGGDAPSAVEDAIAYTYGSTSKSDVLKAGHHGSRYSTSDYWLTVTDPGLVVISAGEGNSYGHPHQEVIDRAAASGAAIRSTIDEGAIVLMSDGVSIKNR